jgi:hypothetical protein
MQRDPRATSLPYSCSHEEQCQQHKDDRDALAADEDRAGSRAVDAGDHVHSATMRGALRAADAEDEPVEPIRPVPAGAMSRIAHLHDPRPDEIPAAPRLSSAESQLT